MLTYHRKDDGSVIVYGISSDTKPFQDVGNAWIFYEMDTQQVYMFDAPANTWRNQTGGSDIVEPSDGGGDGGGGEQVTLTCLSVNNGYPLDPEFEAGSTNYGPYVASVAGGYVELAATASDSNAWITISYNFNESSMQGTFQEAIYLKDGQNDITINVGAGYSNAIYGVMVKVYTDVYPEDPDNPTENPAELGWYEQTSDGVFEHTKDETVVPDKTYYIYADDK